jgi:S1-C subfamily serine protease
VGRGLRWAAPLAVAVAIAMNLGQAAAQPSPATAASDKPATPDKPAPDKATPDKATTPANGVAAAPSDPVRELAARATASTVGLYCKKDGYASFFGTGTVVAEDGHILTSTTVVPPGAEEIMVVFANFSRRQGSIVESNAQLETTLIKVDGLGLTYLPLASDFPMVGSRAFTTSNANNVVLISGTASFSMGHVSGLYEVKDLGGESLYAGMAIETTAAVNPGSDGGPIINDRGQLCGVISLNVSTSRWQGVGVPTKVILDRLESFKSERVKPRRDPLFEKSIVDESTIELTRHAEDWSKYLIGLRVERKYAPEVLPRMPWEVFVKEIKDWGTLGAEKRQQVLGDFFESSRLIEVNQMLRQPVDAATGVVVSSNGLILTSLFNVADEDVFLNKATKEPHRVKFTGKASDLVKPPAEGTERSNNPVVKVTALLADGSTREATIVARHVPLGVALLKIDAADLPAANLPESTAAPELGESVGLIGFAGGTGTRFTLNSGIVSAPSRTRGFHFQTDAMLNYGNSGGPVLSTSGRLLGIATAPIIPGTIQGRILQDQELNRWEIAPNSGVGLIAWAPKIRDVFESMKSGTSTLKLAGAYMGISPDPSSVFGQAAVLGLVGPGTPAGNAGLKRGDRVLEIDGEEVEDWKDLMAHLAEHKPGDRIRLKIQRPGIQKALVVKGKRVTNEAELQELLKSVDASGKFEGQFEVIDTKEFDIVLGERP